MKKCKYLLIILISHLAVSQNLVPNPSFENFTNCPTLAGLPCPNTNIGSFDGIDFWKNPTCQTSDVFNSCTTNSAISVPNNNLGSQSPRTGNAYAGLYSALNLSPGPHYSEYISSPLASPLIPGSQYAISFYVSCGDADFALWNSSNAIGAYLSVGQPVPTGSMAVTRLFMTAQVMNPTANVINDAINWVLISDTIIASGGENYITIGNFTPEPSLLGTGVYFYIDDVSVEMINTTTSIIKSNLEKSIIFSPNPANDILNITFTMEALDKEFTKAEILNSIGQVVKEIDLNYINKKAEANLKELPNGVYLLNIKGGNSQTVSKRFVVSK